MIHPKETRDACVEEGRTTGRRNEFLVVAKRREGGMSLRGGATTRLAAALDANAFRVKLRMGWPSRFVAAWQPANIG